MRPPRYYGHFILSQRKAHTFSYKKIPLMRRDPQQPHCEIPTCIILYKFTPLIRPLNANAHSKEYK